MRFKSLVVAVVAAMMITNPGPALAGGSPAALDHCNDWTRYVNPSGFWFMMPSVGNQTGAVSCLLSTVDVSAAVWVLQNMSLNECHNAGLVQDGNYGQLTKNAVTWMQAAAGFPSSDVDGVYGPKTAQRALKWAYYLGNRPQGCLLVTFPISAPIGRSAQIPSVAAVGIPGEFQPARP